MPSSPARAGAKHVKGMLGPFLRWNRGLGLFLGSLQGTQTSFHLVVWTMSMHEASAGHPLQLRQPRLTRSHGSQPTELHLDPGSLAPVWPITTTLTISLSTLGVRVLPPETTDRTFAWTGPSPLAPTTPQGAAHPSSPSLVVAPCGPSVSPWVQLPLRRGQRSPRMVK